jgi:hypothetical protein
MTRSTDASGSGSCSAVPSMNVSRGSSLASRATRTIPAAASTPVSSRAPGAATASCRSAYPVPDPTSSTRSGAGATARADRTARSARSRWNRPSRPLS